MSHITHSRFSQSPAAPAVASALLAICLYAVTLGGTYVFDDLAIVRDDPRIHYPTQWYRIWTTDYFNGGVDNLYRPLITSSYAIQWQLNGDRPWMFHAVNILLHALTAAGVAEFTRRALRQSSVAQSAAWIAGLLFAAHPVHVEAVANIVGRAESLCALLIFAGLILLCSSQLNIRRVLGILCIGILAMLSKEQGMLQPLLWLLLICLVWQNPFGAGKKTLQIFVLLTTWIWAAYLLLRERYFRFEWDRSTMDPVLQPLLLSQGFDRALMPVVLLGHYTKLLLWPRHLIPDYSGDVIGSVAHVSDPFLWLGFASIAAWIISVFFCLKKIRPMQRMVDPSSQLPRFLLFCLLCLAITYGMIGNIVSLILTNFGERLVYLPSAFFLMIVAVLLSLVPAKPRTIFLTITLLLCTVRTVTAAREWNNPTVLFEHALTNEPESIQLGFLLSMEYHRAGNRAAALALLDDFSKKYPDYWRVWMYRAAEDIDDRRVDDAQMSLLRALKLRADPQLWGLEDRLEKLKASMQP